MGRVSDGTRTWRGKDLAERASVRRNQLFTAALDLIDEGGITAVTVRGVCATSRLTARYFYESFTDLTDLITSLYDELASQAVEAIASGVTSAIDDETDPLGSFVRSGMAYLSADPRACRFLLVHAAGHPPMHQRRRALIDDLLARATRIWTRAVPDAPSLVTSGLAARFALGGLIEFATAYLEGRLDLTEDECAEAALGLLRAFVTSEGGLHTS